MLTDRYSKEQLILQNLLKKLRNDLILTQGALADKLNTPQSFISKYESGERHLSFIELRSICKALDTNITDFSKLFEASVQKNESK
jgi:transcriptional regulator with XRE-family HTH domain